MKISIGCDHGGYKLKTELVKYLKSKKYEIIDCGCFSEQSVDYPLFAKQTAKEVKKGRADFGIVICTSGEGVTIAANKVRGIRCALGYNDDVARLARQHNNANMISFGQAYTSVDEAKKRVDIFLSTEFEGGRHLRRVKQINKIR